MDGPKNTITIDFSGIRQKVKAGVYDPTATIEQTLCIADKLKKMISHQKRAEGLVSSIQRQTVIHIRETMGTKRKRKSHYSGSENPGNTKGGRQTSEAEKCEAEKWILTPRGDDCEANSPTSTVSSESKYFNSPRASSTDSVSPRHVLRNSLRYSRYSGSTGFPLDRNSMFDACQSPPLTCGHPRTASGDSIPYSYRRPGGDSIGLRLRDMSGSIAGEFYEGSPLPPIVDCDGDPLPRLDYDGRPLPPLDYDGRPFLPIGYDYDGHTCMDYGYGFGADTSDADLSPGQPQTYQMEDEIQQEIKELERKIQMKKNVLERQVGQKPRMSGFAHQERFLLHRGCRNSAAPSRRTLPHRTFTKQSSNHLLQVRRSFWETPSESTRNPSSSSDTADTFKNPFERTVPQQRCSFMSDSDFSVARQKSEISRVSIDRDGAESPTSVGRLSESDNEVPDCSIGVAGTMTTEEAAEHHRRATLKAKRASRRARQEKFAETKERLREPKRRFPKASERRRASAHSGPRLIRTNTSLLVPVGGKPQGVTTNCIDAEDNGALPQETEYFCLGDDDEDDHSYCSLENVYENDELLRNDGLTRRSGCYSQIDACTPSAPSTPLTAEGTQKDSAVAAEEKLDLETPRVPSPPSMLVTLPEGAKTGMPDVCSQSACDSKIAHRILPSSIASEIPRDTDVQITQRDSKRFEAETRPVINFQAAAADAPRTYAHSSIREEFSIQVIRNMSLNCNMLTGAAQPAATAQLWSLRYAKNRSIFLRRSSTR